MTWPQISGLLKKVKELPPVDMVAAALVKGMEPKTVGTVGKGPLPVPTKKVKPGTLKRRKSG